MQETATQLKVEEKVLYTEIARIRKEKTGDPVPVSFRTAPQPVPEVTISPSRSVSSNPCETEEMMLIRYLLLFGEMELYREEKDGESYGVSVGEYIIRELLEDELEMLNPRFQEIQKEYRENSKKPDFVPSKYFIGHPDVNVSTTVANIICEPYELSKDMDTKRRFYAYRRNDAGRIIAENCG